MGSVTPNLPRVFLDSSILRVLSLRNEAVAHLYVWPVIGSRWP